MHSKAFLRSHLPEASWRFRGVSTPTRASYVLTSGITGVVGEVTRGSHRGRWIATFLPMDEPSRILGIYPTRREAGDAIRGAFENRYL